jgi:hypothetical protein
MSKKSKRLRTTAARVLRASREHTGELRQVLLGIAVEYKKQAQKEELRRWGTSAVKESNKKPELEKAKARRARI